jgi:hypothetical protein
MNGKLSVKAVYLNVYVTVKSFKFINRCCKSNIISVSALVALVACVSGGTGAWDIGLGADVVLDLGSGSGLGSTFSIFACGVLSLGWVVVFLGDGNGTVDVEGSLGDLAVLFLVVSSGGGFGDLSLIGNGVFVWDNDVLGTDVSVRSSGLGGQLSVGTGSLGSGEFGVLRSEAVSWTVWSTSAVLLLWRWACWGTSTVVLEGDGGDSSDEGGDNEFHFS